MNGRQPAPRHDQPAIRPRAKARDGALNIAGVAHVDRGTSTPNEGRPSLDGGKLAGPGSYGRVSKDCCSRNVRSDLFEQFQTFRAEAILEHSQSR